VERAEVIDLFIEIKEEYGNFDDSDENIDRHLKYLKDFSFEEAMKNVERHIMVSRFYPGIADIRGHLADKKESQRSKDETQSYFAQLEASRLSNTPPPTGYWDHMRTLIRGDI
jgi:hypothetical protein